MTLNNFKERDMWGGGGRKKNNPVNGTGKNDPETLMISHLVTTTTAILGGNETRERSRNKEANANARGKRQTKCAVTPQNAKGGAKTARKWGGSIPQKPQSG